MSFSVSVRGTPDDVKRQLTEESARLTDRSKEEFDAILPALEALVDQNVSPPPATEPIVELIANGHAQFVEGEKSYGACNVSVRRV